MDNFPEDTSLEEIVSLSYDDVVPYEEQVSEIQAAAASIDVRRAALRNRIGNTKVYLLSDSTQTRTAKRKRSELEQDEDVDTNEDSVLRTNALFLTGSPISRLPTARIFAYATHFDGHPMALEWLNDNSCILVFESKALARSAHRYLRKSAAEDMDDEGFLTAKSIPITLWPPEDRINKSLGKGEGVKGAIRMRWAKNDDVKKKGAKKESEFYRKYGTNAGKDGDGPQKRMREGRLQVDASKLDDDLDAFLGKDRPTSYSPPPSNMHADRLGDDRSPIERISSREEPVSLKDRISSAPRERRRSRNGPASRFSDSKWLHIREGRGHSERGEGGGRRNSRPQKTQQDLDDELDAFLNEKD
ncbi:hypothetical protein PAXRUDRAFT_821668 [Paxillus rubicundulus Ve08.2h10]|uniref:Chromatin target of PRMT1 protein C-terminal domain-containing protein n=1 Tax=Paxillus rubicundulus Ve08.2h10 TaxID=930991 RepID=A0A0D0EAM7_9AGAM|nr:hypothetical protein PAXRUDRAFT_821668 [Paxillus rubicundulus Ve08.2h10]